MTRAAGADDLRMVNGKDGRKQVGVVAVFANVARLDVRRILAGCLDTVVAIDAVAGNVHVVEIRRYPTSRCVAVVTSVATRNVARRLSSRRETVVTGATGSGYLGMVDDVHRRKRIGIVTIFAHVGCRYVGWVFSGCICTVVTAAAIADDVDVIEVCRCPARGGMAVITIVAAVQVSWVLARGCDAVVTRAAGANDLRVIDRKHGRENVGRMAVLAYIAGSNVG